MKLKDIISSIISLEKAVAAVDASNAVIFAKRGDCEELRRGYVARTRLARLVNNLRRELARRRDGKQSGANRTRHLNRINMRNMETTRHHLEHAATMIHHGM